MIKLIIWDLDGVIVDSLPLSIYNFEYITKKFAGKKISRREVYDKYLGPHEEEMISDIAPGGRESFAKLKHANLQRIKSFKGIAHVMESARQKGIIQCLVTGRDKKAMDTILDNKYCEKDNIRSYLQLIIAGDDYKGKSAAFKTVMKKFRQSSKHTLVIGDEAKDIRWAKALRINHIGALWGSFDRKALRAAKPDVLLRKPIEIEKVLYQ